MAVTKKVRSKRYMGTVDVTEWRGQTVVEMLKTEFPGKFRYRGRRSNRKELVERFGMRLNTCKDVPICYAERVAVYLKKGNVD